MNHDLIRLIDGICRDKNIDREVFIADLTEAVATALRKKYGEDETVDIQVVFDRNAGRISAVCDGEPVDMVELGRIAAQVAKQGIIQKTRERERASIYEEFAERQGTVVTGSVTRVEGAALIVNIGRAEGFLPRSEQIPGESHQPGDRIRALILEVREMPNQVRIVLSRSHPDFISRLFELEVPEIAEHIIEIRALAREAGYRTKVAVASIDSKVDAVGACVGVRGSRIRNIVDELGGEKIDIVRWNESSQILIGNALKPAEVQEIALCFELGKATVVVAEDQLSLAIGKRGQNVRLAARLTQWDIDIVTPEEYNRNLEIMEATLKRVEGVDDLLVDKLIAMGCTSVEDIDAIDTAPLVEALELSPEMAERIVVEAGEEAIRLQEEREAAEKARAEKLAAGITDEPADAGAATGEAPTGGEPAVEGPAEGPAAAPGESSSGLDVSAASAASEGQAGVLTAEPPVERHALTEDVADPTGLLRAGPGPAPEPAGEEHPR